MIPFKTRSRPNLWPGFLSLIPAYCKYPLYSITSFRLENKITIIIWSFDCYLFYKQFSTAPLFNGDPIWRPYETNSNRNVLAEKFSIHNWFRVSIQPQSYFAFLFACLFVSQYTEFTWKSLSATIWDTRLIFLGRFPTLMSMYFTLSVGQSK